MKRIAIFASGGGSNAQSVINYFSGLSDFDVSLILCNNPKAGVIQRAENHSIPWKLITKGSFYHDMSILAELNSRKIDLIVLAGFLWLIPGYLVEAFDNRILNIHPALLPKFGGKGMYGMNVHKAVKESGEKISGMTVHVVNENFDEGKTLFQVSCPVKEKDTPDDIARRVLSLEHQYYPRVIHYFLREMEVVS